MIERFTVTRYCMPIVKPLFIKKRSGAFVMIQDQNGIVGHGEVAPLPYFSKESLDDAVAQLEELEPQLKGRKLPALQSGLDGELTGWLPDLYPSVRCGIEMALIDLISRRNGKTMRELMTACPRDSVMVNSLISAEEGDVLYRAEEMLDAGTRSLKVKVGRQTVSRDIEIVRELCECLQGRAELRLDANQSWDFERAVKFGKAVSNCSVSYVEEPLKDPTQLEEWARETRLRYALDETLQINPHMPLEDRTGMAAVILKPMLIGGFELAANIARRAQAVDAKAVISGSFETVRGLAALAQLAASLPNSDVATGLDTGSWFTGPSLPVRQGVLDLQELSPRAESEAVSC